MNPLSIFVCIVCALVIGYVVGWLCCSRGREDWKALGWLEYRETDVAKERARHDRQGKFCTRRKAL